MPKILRKPTILALLVLVVAALSSVSLGEAPVKPGFSANVMAPLHVMNYNDPDLMEDPLDWQSFEKELALAKTMGVDGVSVDVWWGDVEARGDNLFDWSYYQKVFRMIKDAGLRIIPIISLHQCGGNVGDTYTCLLPAWMWGRIKGNLNIDDLKYQSELGNICDEYVSLWADDYVKPQYEEFMRAFARFCVANQFCNALDEINISCGPAGELRYPSYNSHDWIFAAPTSNELWQTQDAKGNIVLRGDRTNWPHRGAVQWYGKLPLQDFRRKMKTKYHSLGRLKTAWGADAQGLKDFEAIQFPDQGTDHGYPDGRNFRADQLFLSGAYYKTQYGRDLIAWYNQALVDHGSLMLGLAHRVFSGPNFRQVPLGFKVPGIHWQMGTLGRAQPVAPRAAEIATGILGPSPNFAQGFDLDSERNTKGHGYQNIISLGKALNRKINLHFTCLEMGNNETGGMGETPNQYSLAKALVGWVAMEAYRQGVSIKGENALSAGLPWTNEDFPGAWVDAWDHIDQALERYPYAGITILRLTDVTTATNPTNGKAVGQACYQELIAKFKQHSVVEDELTVYYQGPGDKLGKAYSLYAWIDGERIEYPMRFDGAYRNGYWWKVTLKAPNYFSFSISEQPAITRVYTRYPENDIPEIPAYAILIRHGDPMVYYEGVPAQP